ncbi:MAG: AAA family ATPase [Actinobacteria bacterium]|nr:MAG: AAA family ATPase [Actinomycetota bacterium]
MTEAREGAFPVLDRVPGQDHAMAFLRQAAARPHQAYVLAGPEGGGKQLAARAFAAALLCKVGGCGTCRDCRLALEDRHPNEVVVEPEGRDIHVETVRSEIWHPAYRTAPEPGRKVFVIREADRLNPAAADVLLKVLEEPPAETVLMLLSARPDELPETVLSRCHVVSFRPLSEGFVAQTLVAEGIDGQRAALAARLAGGNLGRARRLASGSDGMSFREAARDAIEHASRGQAGALQAADLVLVAAERYRKDLGAQLEEELAPFLDERAGRGGLSRRDPTARGTAQAAGPAGGAGLRGPRPARGLGAGARPRGRRRRGRLRGHDEPGSRAAARRRGGRRRGHGRGRGGARRAGRGPEPEHAPGPRGGLPSRRPDLVARQVVRSVVLASLSHHAPGASMTPRTTADDGSSAHRGRPGAVPVGGPDGRGRHRRIRRRGRGRDR